MTHAHRKAVANPGDHALTCCSVRASAAFEGLEISPGQARYRQRPPGDFMVREKGLGFAVALTDALNWQYENERTLTAPGRVLEGLYPPREGG